jgi:3-deoxy-7-phosphoheptulonate synthase
MRENGLTPKIMVDCSHGNSQKNHRNQKGVLQNVMHQIKNRTSNSTSNPTSIIGVMLESNIKEGKQTLTKLNYNSLLPGISITDGCISIEETEKIIKEAYSTILM